MAKRRGVGRGRGNGRGNSKDIIGKTEVLVNYVIAPSDDLEVFDDADSSGNLEVMKVVVEPMISHTEDILVEGGEMSNEDRLIDSELGHQ